MSLSLNRPSKLLSHEVLYYNNDQNLAITKLVSLCIKYNARLISIGDGVGSWEAQEMAAKAIEQLGSERCKFSVVSEAGASVYSASPAAKEEYPDTAITFLGAVSIAQRLGLVLFSIN
jgi:uncharacterized protein